MALASTSRKTFPKRQGEVRVPIMIASIAIETGDHLLADADGAVLLADPRPL